MRKLVLTAIAFALVCPVVLTGQDYMRNISKSELQSEMNSYIDQVVSIGANLSNARAEQLDVANRSIQIVDAKWMDFFQKSADYISADEELLNLSFDYEQARSAAQDSITVRKERLEKAVIFVKSENFIANKAAEYLELEKKATELSLTKYTAKELENLKAKETIEFMDITKAFTTAKDAADINPALKQRMTALQSRYIAIQNSSSKIQAMEFVPLVTRIKDYLLSLAAVAIIMMFFIFIGNYIKTLKTAKESAKQMEEILQKNDREIPTI